MNYGDRVRVIANKCDGVDYLDITNLIGKEFKVLTFDEEDRSVIIEDDYNSELTLFDGEYECIGGLATKENVEKLIENLSRPTIHTNMLMIMEERELRLRKLSGYTVDELVELFLSGAVEINKDRIPLSLINLKGEQYV